MEYLIVSKFAEKAGVSVQAIYKRLNKDLEPYVKVENGVKLISEDALKFFSVVQQVKQNNYVQELEETIESLKLEIESLKQDKLSLNEQIVSNNAVLMELLQKQTQQSENFQVLLSQQNQLMQQTLNQLPSTIQAIENRLNEVDNNLNKPVKKKFFHFWKK